MPELAYLNGEIMPIEDALVPIEDRGYQFGDAVYEYVASYNGRLFCLAQHLDRLERSMRELAFPEGLRDGVRTGIQSLFAAAEMARVGIYIQISRGVEPRNHAYSTGIPVQTVMTVRPLPDVHPHAETGAAVITVPDIRWKRCDIKTVQLLPNVLAKQKALEGGVYDAIFVAADGVVREATSSNVFMVKNNAVITHPLTPDILPGITRQVIFDICKSTAIQIQERFFTDKELFKADEVFLSGTVTEVLPIVRIDGRPVGNETAGCITRDLYQALREKAGA
jgi:D-alanine transaminase